MSIESRERTEERISEVEAHSAALPKQLGLADLALIQILYVVGSAWVGTAAKLGTGHVYLWLAAIALYYLPQAAVVIYLNRLLPLEGGLYQWATVGFGEFTGFLVAWNQWAYAILVMAGFAVVIATNLSYLIGPAAPWLIGAAWYTPAISIIAIAGITVVTLFGQQVGKWIQDVGGASQLLTYSALIAIPIIALHRGAISSYHPLATSVPPITPLNLNLFGKMALGALSGFEYVAIMAGETRNPARSIGRSVLIAVPIIAVMFILGTSSVVALVPRDHIDLVSPIPQTLTIGFQGLGFARLIVPILIALLLMRQLGSMTLLFAGNARLPMVAGWDGLLPAWFTRMHPRFKTPRNSILFVGALTLGLCLAGQRGVGVQEAFQLLENAAGIFYAFTYLALFAIPVLAARRLSERPPRWLQIAAIAGFAVTLLYTVLSVFPIIDVPSWKFFAAKIISVLLGANLLGIGIYLAGRRSASVLKSKQNSAT
jgi:amino acid transporter